jgi:hypothetical protein
MPALRELISRHGIDVAAHLDRDADIPVLTGPQAQGDISIRPVGRWPVRVAGSRFRRGRPGQRRRAAAVTSVPPGASSSPQGGKATSTCFCAAWRGSTRHSQLPASC